MGPRVGALYHNLRYHFSLSVGDAHSFVLAQLGIQWHECPVRRIDSFIAPRGCLTRPGMANHEGSHADWYADFPALGAAQEK